MTGAELTRRGSPFGREVTVDDFVTEPTRDARFVGTTDVPAPDLAALLVIDAALAPLDEAARDRVMEWLCSKWRRA